MPIRAGAAPADARIAGEADATAGAAVVQVEFGVDALAAALVAARRADTAP